MTVSVFVRTGKGCTVACHVTGVVTVVAAIAGVREHPVVGRKGGKD